MRVFAAILALILVTPANAQPAAPDLSRITDDHRAALRCSALFAIIASEQMRGVESALRLPMLDYRGREFFVRTGAKVIEEAGIPREAVARLMEDEVARLQQQAMSRENPDVVMAEAMTACQPLLDAAIPPLETPSLAQCAAILSLTAEALEAREGLVPSVMDMKTLASVLDSRARKQLTEQGKSGNEADVIMGTAREVIAADEAAGVAGRIDIAHCFTLAAPEPDPHLPHQ